MTTKLTEEQIRQVLSRAEEIHLREALEQATDDELESVLSAAEELGLPRDAVRKAVHEQLGIPLVPPKEGDLAFARSADGHYYVADVLSTNEQSARVRFVKGEEHEVPLADLRSCTFLPGQKVVARWPFWGWWESEVVSYNAARRRVKVSDGWSQKTFPLNDIRMAPPRPIRRPGKAGLYWLVFAVGLIAGSGVGGFLAWLFMR